MKPGRKPSPKQTAAGPPPAMPDTPPEFLNATGLAYWHATGPRLVELGVLTPLDGAAFGKLCWCEQTFAAAAAQVTALGLHVKNSQGQAVDNPAFAKALKLIDAACRLGEMFALNPLDRARVNVKPTGPQPGDALRLFQAKKNA